MKKNKLLITIVFLTSGLATAQVGINNQSPKATLDITAKNTNGSTAEGLIAPRLTGDQIKAADAQYSTAQKGAMVYATAAVTTASTKTAAITAEGYYYFDGSLWQKVANGSTYSGSSSVIINGSAFERAALTGDVTALQNSNATTIANNAVTSAKISDGTIATVDIANNAVTVAKLPSGATGTNFLRGDGTWAVPTDTNTTYTGSTSISLNGTSFERAPLTGDVTATQNSNTVTIATGAVDSGKIADGTVANADLATGVGGIYKGSGSLSGTTTVAQGTNTLGFTSTATTGTSHFTVDGNTLNVDAVNNNVGIGTSSPTTRLDVSSGEARLGVSGGTQTRVGVGYIDFYDSSGVLKSNIAANNANGELYLNTLSTNTLINATAGNVGVGTVAPSTKLEVNSGTANDSGLKFTNLNSSTPVSAGSTLGVDANGKVVTVPGNAFVPSYGLVTGPTTINLPNSSPILIASITLPSNGTYLITYSVRGQVLIGEDQATNISVYVTSGSAPGTIIPNSEILIVQPINTPNALGGGTGTGTLIRTVTGGSEILNVYAISRVGSGISYSDSNGRSVVSYVKITP